MGRTVVVSAGMAATATPLAATILAAVRLREQLSQAQGRTTANPRTCEGRDHQISGQHDAEHDERLAIPHRHKPGILQRGLPDPLSMIRSVPRIIKGVSCFPSSQSRESSGGLAVDEGRSWVVFFLDAKSCLSHPGLHCEPGFRVTARLVLPVSVAGSDRQSLHHSSPSLQSLRLAMSGS
jgi:hypothetical protein